MKRPSAGLVVCALLAATPAQAAPPYASYWYPDTLLNWSPANDPDARFNRASVPLRPRALAPNLNPSASSRPRVMSLSVMQPSTSANPSQWSDTFDAYTFTYWPYVDSLVSFAGSAGEGIIVPPTSGVIDAAHRNGTPVYGTVFFPPATYGGQVKWLDDFLQRDSQGHFPVADRLIRVAQYYGFDGWFINQETTGLGDRAAAFTDFLRYFHRVKPEGMKLVWYDAMVPDNGKIRWQNMLNSRNAPLFGTAQDPLADAFFLNFWWTNPEDIAETSDQLEQLQEPRIVAKGQEEQLLNLSNAQARQLGRDPLDVYAGINVQAYGYDTANESDSDSRNLAWDKIFPDGTGDSAQVSVGLFGSEWAQRRTRDWQSFQQADNRLWVGINGDPRATTTQHNWKGIAQYVTARTALTQLPFQTDFNIGQGHLYAVQGRVVRNRDWNFMGVQDQMPTWRYVVDNAGGNELTAGFSLDQAYQGGSSLTIGGSSAPGGRSHVQLYAAQAPLRGGERVQMAFRAPADCLRASVQVDGRGWADLAWNRSENRSGWTWGEASLPPGTTLTGLGVSVTCAVTDDAPLYVGHLAVNSARDSRLAFPVTNLTLTPTVRDAIYSDARLTWASLAKPGDRFEIYRQRPDGQAELMAVSNVGAAYIPEFRRLDKEDVTRFSVVPVSSSGGRGAPTEVALQWPAYPAPKANFLPSDTFVAPGSGVTFTNKSSEVAEAYTWTFEGAIPATSAEVNPTVTYPQPGTYAVTLQARNTAGQDTVTLQGLITVSPEAARVTNLALGKAATADGQCAASEAPALALDGKLDTKWCALGNAPHQLTVDLGESYRVSGFRVAHAEAGGESASMNTRAFEIQVSADGQTWTTAATIQDNAARDTKVSVAQTSARFVRLLVVKPTQGGDTAARIYEFEVLGLPR